MYPRDFFDTYWRTDRRNEIFIAMPFHDEFTPVWERAIRPAIEEDQRSITAKRVDATILSGSIVIEILDGIAHSRLVFADISVACKGRWAGQRNGNVMYEVGLAHAVRQATEVILVRSDEEPINFDLAQINIHRYDRNHLDNARGLFLRLISEALRQVQLEKSLKVARAIDLLDASSIRYLSEFASKGPFTGPAPKTMGEELIAISNRAALAHLQQLGIIRCHPVPTDSPAVFTLTEFGKAIVARLEIK